MAMIKNSIEKMPKSEAIEQLTKLGGGNIASGIASAAGCVDDLAVGAKVATTSSGALGTVFSGLGTTILGALSTPLGMFTATAGGIALVTGAAHLAYKAFFDYGTAAEKAQESASAYQADLSGLNSLQSALANTNAQIEGIHSKGKLTLTDEADLSRLQQQRTELEQRIAIQEKLAEVSGKAASKDAEDALGKLVTSEASKYIDDEQTYSKLKVGRQKMTNAQALDLDVEKIKEYQKEVDKLREKQQKKGTSSSDFDQYQKEIDEYQKKLDVLDAEAAGFANNIQTQLGNITDKGSAVYKENQNSLNDYLTMGMSKQEKGAYSLNNFFDGSPGKNLIKEDLLQAAQAGGNLKKVLSGLGLSLSDLGKGVTGESLTNYFQNLAREAKEAEDAANGVNGSFEGIQAAQASQNQGYEWDAMSQNLKKGQELYESGAIGTDDFQTMAQWMVPGKIDTEGFKTPAEAYKKAWEDTYNTVSRWFNAENPVESMWTFAEDLSSKNSDMFQVLNKETNEIIPNFKTTAEAADALGVSVGAVESILGKMQEYGYEFEGVLFSGEALDEYKQSLEGIRELVGGMEEGDRKEKLLGSLSLWDENYEKYQEDMSLLTEDQVVQIKFEYELAEIEQNIEYLREKASLTQSPEDWAELTLVQRDYRETREEQIGYNEDSDAGYGQSYDALTEIQDELRDAPENEIPVLEDQITAIYDLQTAFLDLRAAGEDMDWNTFLNSEEAQSTFDSIIEATGITREQLAEILGTEITVPPIPTEELDAQLSTLETGKEIQFTANVSGVAQQLSIVKNEDGFISYTATNIDGVQTQVQPVRNQDGTVTFEPVTDAVKAYQAPEKPGKALYKGNFDNVGKPPILTGVVNFFSNFVQGIFGGGKNSNDGPGHLHGTAPEFTGQAFESGTLGDTRWLRPRWKTKQSEVALTGEVGQEIVVHGNRWWTVGDRGAEFSPIPQGSVVFNARQTRDLLNKGFTNSRGRAHLYGTEPGSGTARISGTAYADGSADQAAKDALKELSNFFNWITINMDRLSRQSKLASNAIESAVGLSAKQAAASEALESVRAERDAVEQSSKRYLEHAQWYARESGLSPDLQQKVQNGTIDISKYDEDTQAKIKEYQQYYEKYLDMLDKATDLEKKESDLVEKRLKNIESFYKLVTKVSESVQDMNDAKLKYEAARGYSAVSDQVKAVYQSSLKESQNTYNSLSKQLVDYQTEFDTLVKNGSITKGSGQWYEGLAKINGFQEDIYKAGVTIVEYEDKIRGIEYTKLENLISGFERAVKSLDGRVSLKKARDEKISESDYQTNINLNNSTIRENMKLRDKKLKEQSLYDVNSKEYQDLAKDISSLDKETYNLLVDNEKLKDSIFELRFTPLDEGIEKYQDLHGELRNFQGLLNKDAFFDKNGAITETGLANLALLQQQLATTKKEIADYRTGLDKLSESYKNGVISEKEYNEKSQEYREGIQDAAGDVVDYQEKLTDLYMTQMKAEVDALQEVIDKRKDALDAKADYYDYDKKLKSQTKDVNVLKSQIAAMEGVNDAATQAKVKQLRQQLADAEDKLGETKRDHAIDMQKEGYNGLSNDMEKMLDHTEYEIIHNSEKQQSVIESMLSNVVNMYESAYGKINSIIANTGWVGSTDFNTTQSQLSTQTGAANQTTSAAQSQSSTKASSTATSTKTSSINNDDASHKNTEAELAKPENTTNRLVAEVTLSTTSVTLEEGQTTTVSAQSIRPTDAKNKNLSWTSNNSQIATVSNGTIRALKPGSCQIIASTKDGSKINVPVNVTVTKKPDPPKPQPKPATPKSGGDGVPNIGDAVTFANGIYYLDSYGTAPSGNQMMGQTVYITYMNPGAPKPIHISRTKTPGERDLGWLSLSQLKGYKSGSKNIDTEQLAWTQEDGRELIMRKSDGAMLTKLSPGDAVAPNHLTENLFKWGEVNPQTFFANAIDTSANVPIMGTGQNVTIEQHYDSLIHVEGNVDQDVLADLKAYEKDFLDKSYKYTTNMIAKDCQKVGIRRK